MLLLVVFSGSRGQKAALRPTSTRALGETFIAPLINICHPLMGTPQTFKQNYLQGPSEAPPTNPRTHHLDRHSFFQIRVERQGMWDQVGLHVLQECLLSLLGWRELGKQVCFLGQLDLSLLWGQLGSSVINLGQKALHRDLSHQTSARRAALPEVIQPLSQKYQLPAVQGSGELQRILVLCETSERQINSLCTQNTTCLFILTTGLGWEKEVVKRLVSSFWGGGQGKRDSLEKLELIIFLVHSTESLLCTRPLSCFLVYFIPTVQSHWSPLQKQNCSSGFGIYPLFVHFLEILKLPFVCMHY